MRMWVWREQTCWLVSESGLGTTSQRDTVSFVLHGTCVLYAQRGIRSSKGSSIFQSTSAFIALYQLESQGSRSTCLTDAPVLLNHLLLPSAQTCTIPQHTLFSTPGVTFSRPLFLCNTLGSNLIYPPTGNIPSLLSGQLSPVPELIHCHTNRSRP